MNSSQEKVSGLEGMSSSQIDLFTNDYDDWMCTICREGDGVDGCRTLHACGKHEFHTICIQTHRERDTRCPICRFPVGEIPLTPETTQSSEESQPDEFYSMMGGLAFAMMRFPNMLYQIMPNRQNRIRLQISKCGGFDGDCGYCRRPLLRCLDAFQRHTCHHRIHHSCVMDNILENGISENGTLFCPKCHAEGS